jgi:hypothetical protein
MSTEERAVASRWKRALPALTLVLAAPLVAEVLPGATRFSSLFVLPVEMCVWGGGALMIRYAVRRWRLGWPHMLALALALAIAEECLIQQTSLAPMVLRLKGETYARAFGVNYVYFLWALVYEAVFVVILLIEGVATRSGVLTHSRSAFRLADPGKAEFCGSAFGHTPNTQL